MTTAALMATQLAIQAMPRANSPSKMAVMAPATARGSYPGGPGSRGDKPGARGLRGKAGEVTGCMTAPFTKGEPARTDLPMGPEEALDDVGELAEAAAAAAVESAPGTAVTTPPSANSACTTSGGKFTGA